MPLHNQEMSLVLSSDAKPRLKWTPELHQRFIEAVKQLGGAEKATPKSLMRVMGIHGLTLYHLKSHLQKYRLGRSQQSQTFQQNTEEESGEENERSHSTNNNCDAVEEKTNDVQAAEALKLQMEVQRKLHQQIEVQRHLQLRIEAQGRYLQSVLKKAQETLSGYSACSIEVENARAQLCQLASMVESGCTTASSLSSDGKYAAAAEKLLGDGRNGYSIESSLTSSESSERKDGRGKRKRNPANSDSENGDGGRKRSGSGGAAVDGAEKEIDLNEFDSGHRGFDLNCDGIRLFGSTF